MLWGRMMARRMVTGAGMAAETRSLASTPGKARAARFHAAVSCGDSGGAAESQWIRTVFHAATPRRTRAKAIHRRKAPSRICAYDAETVQTLGLRACCTCGVFTGCGAEGASENAGAGVTKSGGR